MRSGAARLSLAMVASGVLTYAFQVLAARSLGPEAYGDIAVLWAAMFLVGRGPLPARRADDVPRDRRAAGAGERRPGASSAPACS